MPYIKHDQRKALDPEIDILLRRLLPVGSYAPAPGDLNYVLSRIVWGVFQKFPGYAVANMLVGMLDCVKLEFYRRLVVPYEEEKIKENGDLYVQ
jgi:hypothetical protein